MTPERLTIPALISHRRQLGDHRLLVCDSDRLSYTQAEELSARLAGGLIALGAGKGTHVGLLYPNGADFVVGMLAAARIGAVVVPFSTFSTAAELHRQLAHSDVGILLSCPRFRGHDYRHVLGVALDLGRLSQLRHIVFDAAALDGDGITGLESDVEESDPMAIIYTSGSTGHPKGAIHTQRGLLEHQHNLNVIRGLTQQTTLFCNSPFFWIGGFAFGLLATLVAGATLVCSNADPAGTLDLIEAEKPDMTNGFVSSILPLTRDPSFAGRDLSSIRRGNLYPIMAPACRPGDPELRHNMLGMTEAGSVVLLSGDDTDQPEHRRGSFGRPAPGFEVQIVDGELWIRGPYVMQRYQKLSREECFDSDGWFHTGDLVRVDADGFFYYLGRAGSLIKTAGANVSPAEVERALTTVTGWPAHVVGLPDGVRGQLVAAALVTEDPADFDESQVRAALRDTLSTYKIPRRFLLLPRLPLTAGGKVDIPALHALFDD